LGSVSDYNAMNEITQTNFTIPTIIPNVDCEHCVVRIRYISQNPTENDRGMTFYQCADVKVNKNANVVAAPAVPQPLPPVTGGGEECCAPSQFTMEGYETASWRNPTYKKYFFDAPKQLFRIDTYSGKGTSNLDGSFQMYNNFTSGIEYYYNVAENSCDLYGLNYWADWCYGSVNTEKFDHSFNVGSEIADVWGQGPNDVFTWTNKRTGCVPLSMDRKDTGESTRYFNMKAGEPSPSVFELPAACVRSAEKMKADKKPLPKAPASHVYFKGGKN